jgi:hypothetical protein
MKATSQFSKLQKALEPEKTVVFTGSPATLAGWHDIITVARKDVLAAGGVLANIFAYVHVRQEEHGLGSALERICTHVQGDAAARDATNTTRITSAAKLVVYIQLASYYREFLRRFPELRKEGSDAISLHTHGLALVPLLKCNPRRQLLLFPS